MRKTAALFFSLFFLALTSLRGQLHSRIDSLRDVLIRYKSPCAAPCIEDTVKINLLNALSENFWRTGQYDSAHRYAQLALRLSDVAAKDYIKGYAKSHNNIGSAYYFQGKYQQAVENYQLSIEERSRLVAQLRKEGDSVKVTAALVSLGKGYANLSNVYAHIGDLPSALDMGFESLKIQEQTRNEEGIMGAYLTIGSTYQNTGDLNKSIDYLLKALVLATKINSQKGLSVSNSSLGESYRISGNYDLALYYYRRALVIYEKTNDRNGMSIAYNNIGLVLKNRKQYDSAIYYQQRSLELRQAMKDYYGIGASENNLGEIYAAQGDDRRAIEHFNLGLEAALKSGMLAFIQASYTGLSESYERLGNTGEALKYYKLNIVYRDSIYNKETAKNVLTAEIKYNFDKKTAVEKEKHARENAVAALESKRQRNIILFIVVFAGLIVFFAAFLLNRYRIIRRQKMIIEEQKHLVDEKNKEILDSIHYARRIQQNLLPNEKTIHKNIERLKS